MHSHHGGGSPLVQVSRCASEGIGIYLEPRDKLMIIHDYSDSVDDDLHEQLNFEYPKE
jgi:hypothetical protein